MSELEPTRTYSNPIATDVLRRMLDERGVEWTVPDESWNQDSITYWKVGSIKWVAFESENDTLWLNCNSVTDLTPEQAIAATLGPAYEPPVAAHWDGDTLTLTIPRDPSCIRVQRSAEQPCKVYADESKVIAATLGSCNCTNSERTGTCEADETDLIPFVRADSGDFEVDYIHVMECTECGHVYEHVNGDYEYCPRCGRKRRDVDE